MNEGALMAMAADATPARMMVGTEALLADLIGFDSVSRHSNRAIVDYIVAHLASHGVPSYLLPNAAGDKWAILASIGPLDRPGVVLSAHTDVVPVEGQDWSSPPFAATTRGGRIFGRGATDMKGFIATVLAAVPDFIAAASETPIHIALSYDEELGCAGADDLVAAVAALPARPALCIVGEPTGLNVACAHKGKLARRLVFTGRGGHSALPHRAANAVEAAARMAVALADLGRDLRLRSDAAFDPPWSSVHVGSLHGGGALNLVPDRAVLEFEVRTIPGEDEAALVARLDALVEEARAALKAQAPEADVAVEPISAYPGLATAPDSRATRLACDLAQMEGEPVTLAFGTEAGLYAKAGIPTIVCGPGDISRAHKADEWIGRDELAAAGAMMARIAARLGTPVEDWPASPV
ncbi:acetylornithine deacetylase [Ancylobacter sp. 6x-1]|uniref:Acetylornithine deacetylase n=1 Tax=Ancylobacter crimeensis TaxID=2579147 RepID=A0ABT0DBH4_9HYPH|nr:acetylornithine deacetylase [Ancylobacter crimeensis]MCK0197285.1 acetylornithine deacetylase [Ancylobacter crimeensis]